MDGQEYTSVQVIVVLQYKIWQDTASSIPLSKIQTSYCSTPLGGQHYAPVPGHGRRMIKNVVQTWFCLPTGPLLVQQTCPGNRQYFPFTFIAMRQSLHGYCTLIGSRDETSNLLMQNHRISKRRSSLHKFEKLCFTYSCLYLLNRKTN